MKAILVSAFALGLVACSQGGGQTASTSPIGDWSVDNDQSTLAFVTVKSNEVGESHKFKALSGGVSADGTAKIDVDLASVATNNDTRDGRMKEFLFEVAQYPTAEVTAKLDPAQYENLAVGQRELVPVTLTLNLHGASQPLDTNLYVTRVSNDAVLVETSEPIQVFAEDFGLTPGLAKLQELANLPSIAQVSPVSFSVLLKRG